MKSSIETINPVQCRVSVAVSSDDVNKAFDLAYRKLQRQAKIQGFRPGKAPLSMIRKLYGSNVSAEVSEALVRSHLFSTLREKSIHPVAPPVLEKLEAPKLDHEFNFTALVDMLPTLAIDNYKGIHVTAETFTVNEQTVEQEIQLLCRRQGRGTAVASDTKAALGHLATIAHSVTHNDIPVARMQVDSFDVDLGQNQIFPELEQAIIGMGQGETKMVTLALPADYEEADLAGQTLQFTITLKELKNLVIPAFDDELAKDFQYESADELRDNIRTQLENRGQALRRQKIETAILDKLIAEYPFEVPPAMVDQVIDNLVQEMQHPSEDARKRALSDAALRQTFLPVAKRRTQNALLLWHVSQKENLQVTQEEIRSRADETLKSFGPRDPKDLAYLRQKIESRLQEQLVFEKAFSFLIENAKITDIPSSL